LRYFKNVLAKDGEKGAKQNSTGADGEDIIIEVPLGTVVRNEETGEQIVEILEHNQKEIAVRGGRGGQGNSHFVTSTKQAPEYAQPGELGTEGWFNIELKILADIGLVGFPNAGKSTLLSVISAAKPKIANYAFTTLTPNLGMVQYKKYESFCVADLPGIIEGAAEGKGLGHRFLRHIERNSGLLLVIPADSANHVQEYETIINELEEYNPELLDKQHILGISKCEMLDTELRKEISNLFKGKENILFFSSITTEGLENLKDAMWKMING
jgi:GTP-binding protein